MSSQTASKPKGALAPFPVVSALLLTLTFASAASHAQENNGTLSQPRVKAEAPATQRVIVKWRAAGTAGLVKTQDRAARVQKLGADTGLRLKVAQQIAPALDVVELEAAVAGAALDDVLARVRADAAVEFAEPDERRHAHAVPSDALFVNQWYLRGTQIAGARVEQGWDSTTGSAGTVVAVLDTGVRYDHTDLGRATQGGKILPGFDFVSQDSDGTFSTANDGNARDSDPSDPGDWIDAADLQRPAFSGRGCTTSNSSWHGTRVAGIVGAMSDNGTGIAGIGWTTWVLPVRVLGKCGGNDSDILAAMRWAAGFVVAGAATNPFPAKVINLSLGSDGLCRQSYVSVMNELTAAGVLVIASAGNDGGSVDAPANCPGVLAVGAVRHIGTKVGFSNVGPGVAISAPGGNCVNVGPGQPCLFSIDTTTDTGQTAPVSPAFTDQINFNVGTSFSAPIVAGTAGLMHAVNAKLSTSLLTARLREGARPFPTTSNSPATAQCPLPVPTCHVPVNDADLQTCECICTTQTCGAGMLDAAGAVAAALRPAVSIQVPANVAPGLDVVLNANASAASCNRTITAFAWTVQSGTAVITGADQAIATVQAPTTGSFTLRLTVTDSQGAQDSADVVVTPTSATTTAAALLAGNACPAAITVPPDPPPPPPPPPPPSGGGGGGGGGGGALGWSLLFVLLGVSCAGFTRRWMETNRRK